MAAQKTSRLGRQRQKRQEAGLLGWRNECKRLVGWGHRGWLAKGFKKPRKNASDYTTTSRLGGEIAPKTSRLGAKTPARWVTTRKVPDDLS